MWGIPVALSLFLVVCAVVALAGMARANFRRRVRRELIAYLQEKLPGFAVETESDDAIAFKSTDIGGQMNLHNLYRMVVQVRPNTADIRRQVYERFTAALMEHSHDSKLTLENHGERVLPRIVPPEFLNQLPNEADLPQRPIGWTGLVVLYVLDSEHNVMYLTREHAEELGLDDAALHELALANLRRRFDPALVRQVVEENAVQVVKYLDSHDAARLLLVREHLKEEERIAAVIPDRDTLLLAPLPVDNDWDGLRRLALAASGPPLCEQPLRVTSGTIELVPEDEGENP